MNRILTIALATIFVAASTSAQDIKVHVDYDKNADFSKIETFAWKDGTLVANQLVHQRIVNAIDYHLTMNGMREVDEDPDVIVTYHASVKDELRFDSRNYDYFYGAGWGRYGYAGRYGSLGSSTTVSTYQVGADRKTTDQVPESEKNAHLRCGRRRHAGNHS